MNFFIFIALIALSNAALMPILKNPEEFIASMVDANPATLNKMKEMVKDLIEQGEAERVVVIEAHNAATARFNTATSEQAAAEEAKNIAGGNKQNALNDKNAKASVEDTARAKKADALNVLNAATAHAASMASIRTAEVIRLDAEKALMEQVLVKLETLLPGVDLLEGKLTVVDFIVGRRLLATSEEMADRDAVQRVVDKINLLVGTGEMERKHAIRNDEDAAEALVVATTAHDVAVAEHQTAAGQLGAAEAEFDKMSGIFRVKCEEKDTADAELADATSDLAAKKANRESEEARLNSEKATLEQVDGLLDDLLASE